MRLFLHRCLTQLRRRWHLRLAPSSPSRHSASFPSPSPLPRWRYAFVLLAFLLLISGPLLFNWHVQHLSSQLPAAESDVRLPSWQKILPGLRFQVPGQSSIAWLPHPEGGLWIMAGMKEEAPVSIDLCRQQADARHWIPVTIGAPFADIMQRIKRNQARHIPDAAGLKSVVLSEELGPQVEAGAVQEDADTKQLTWRLRIAAGKFPTSVLSDADPGRMQQVGGADITQSGLLAMKKEAWLHWSGPDGPRALHLQQRTQGGGACEYGQLQLQWYRAAKTAGRAWVQPFTWQLGALPRAYLAAGSYQIPALAAQPLEDQQLFEALLQNGLLRLNSGISDINPSQIELVPREWPIVQAGAGAGAVAEQGKAWPATNPQLKRLWQRLYNGAEGSYVRQQIQVFNREQTLGTRPGDLAYRHIKIIKKDKSGKLDKLGTEPEFALEWQTVRRGLPSGVSSMAAYASASGQSGEVNIADRQGRALWANGQMSDAAKQAGLGVLLAEGAGAAGATGAAGEARGAEGTGGAGAGHSLPAMLARAGRSGAAVNARLTLDLNLQTLAQKILECIAMQQGKWNGQGCVLASPTAANPAPPARRAAFVVQDTQTGEILASAQAGPASRPLLAWQHDGSSHASPGSTFKVVTALGLEMAARQQPRLQAMLAGLPLAELNRIASQEGYAFHSNAPCYPMPCDGKQPHLTNYKDHILASKAQAGQFGLVQALSSSMNTWFAWNSEWSDASLLGQASGGIPDLQALQAGTLEPLRPILAAAHQLGFEQPMRLDGGLLPPRFAWQGGDVLQSTAAHIDVSHSRHELRQIALGLRMQSHALQMAQVAAAVAEGEIHPPRLLQQLNLPPLRPIPAAAAVKPGTDDKPDPKMRLVPRLDRIRAGMQDVVQHGTAAQAFAAPELAAIRPFLYGKTGTAPADESNNSAWFIGWVEAGQMSAQMSAQLSTQLPGQAAGHRWAFAVYVSHTDLTGGAHAAPVVAGLLRSLLAGAVPDAPLYALAPALAPAPARGAVMLTKRAPTGNVVLR